MYSACMSSVMKEFGEDHGVVYVDKPEDALWKAIELIEGGAVGEYGSKARGFVGMCGWDDVTDPGRFRGAGGTEEHRGVPGEARRGRGFLARALWRIVGWFYV